MAKSTKPAVTAGHGTQYAYNQGCRCKSCRDANTARKWAERHVAAWDGGIADAVQDGVVFIGPGITITADLLYEALKNYEQRIKSDVLLRYRMRCKA